MALERVPADIRAQGGVARMSDPKMIKEIMDTVTIPVMAKARIGHFVECQVHLSPSVYTLDNPKVPKSLTYGISPPNRFSKPSV
jgi:pyridoxal 5'-phosphate synthase pdxS subunit